MDYRKSLDLVNSHLRKGQKVPDSIAILKTINFPSIDIIIIFTQASEGLDVRLPVAEVLALQLHS